MGARCGRRALAAHQVRTAYDRGAAQARGAIHARRGRPERQGRGRLMRLLSAFREAARVRGVFCDIDNTLTTDGRLTAEAYAALEGGRAAGKLVVPITGRPAGWCDHIARMWPVDAVGGGDGGFSFLFRAAGGRGGG